MRLVSPDGSKELIWLDVQENKKESIDWKKLTFEVLIDIYKKKEVKHAILIGMKKDNSEPIILPMPIKTEEEKKHFYKFASMVLSAYQCESYIYACRIWLSTDLDVQPSESSTKKDVLIIVYVNQKGETDSKTFEIFHTDKKTTLKELEFKQIGGLIFDFLKYDIPEECHEDIKKIYMDFIQNMKK